MFGLSFANPAMLYGLWAALLPVVIHLLNRRRSVTLAFSNVALLQALQHDRMRRVKLKQILLLILRTLLVVLLVLAFARPTLMGSGSSGGAGDAGTTAVILLDRSLGMQYRTPDGTLFERGKSRIREMLALFNAQDDVQVMLVDAGVTPISVSSLTHLAARMDEWHPKFGVANMAPGLEAASEHLMASQMPNRELYIVSSLSRLGWATVADSLTWPGVSVFVLPERPERIQNVSVAQVKTVGGLMRVGQPVTLEIELTNQGDARDVPVQAFWDDRRIIQQVAHTPSDGRKKLYSRFTPDSDGPRALRVEIGDDNLPSDNTRVSVVQVPNQFRVLLVGEADQDTYFLSRALRASSFAVEIKSPDQVTEAVLADADVVYLCHVTTLSRGVVELLRNHVSSGGGLAIVLGGSVDMRHYNERIFPALLPATLISVQGQPGNTTAYQALPPTLPDHPMLSHIQLTETFRSPRFFAHYVVRPEAETRSILSFSNGIPALLEGSLGKGRVVLFVSEWGSSLSWNDMPVTGFFLPFVFNLTGYLVAGTVRQSDYPVGAIVSRPSRNQIKSEGVLRSPGQDAQTLWPEHRGVQSVWPIGPVDHPGLWEIYSQEQLADRFAVQLDPLASDLTRIPESDLRARFQDTKVLEISADQPLKDVVLSLRHGREFWRFFLGSALFLMFLEMWIARSTRSSRQ